MEKFLCDFARHLVNEREGAPIAVSTLVAVFTNRGHFLPGESADEQRHHVRDMLREDEGLALDPDGDTVDTPNAGESAEDFAKRRQAGLDGLKHEQRR